MRAGLLSERREGTWRFYALRPESLEPVRIVLADLWPDALIRLKQVVEQNTRGEEGRRAEETMNQPDTLTTTPGSLYRPQKSFPTWSNHSCLCSGSAPGRICTRSRAASSPSTSTVQLVRGTYVSVEPPNRVVFTWGTPGNDALPPGSSTVEVLLKADGNETVVELFHHDLPVAELSGHKAGWTACLAKLRQVAST